VAVSCSAVNQSQPHGRLWRRGPCFRSLACGCDDIGFISHCALARISAPCSVQGAAVEHQKHSIYRIGKEVGGPSITVRTCAFVHYQTPLRQDNPLLPTHFSPPTKERIAGTSLIHSVYSKLSSFSLSCSSVLSSFRPLRTIPCASLHDSKGGYRSSVTGGTGRYLGRDQRVELLP
jgi:hypothetical protein